MTNVEESKVKSRLMSWNINAVLNQRRLTPRVNFMNDRRLSRNERVIWGLGLKGSSGRDLRGIWIYNILYRVSINVKRYFLFFFFFLPPYRPSYSRLVFISFIKCYVELYKGRLKPLSHWTLGVFFLSYTSCAKRTCTGRMVGEKIDWRLTFETRTVDVSLKNVLRFIIRKRTKRLFVLLKWNFHAAVVPRKWLLKRI